jgi:hypothetical protein
MTDRSIRLLRRHASRLVLVSLLSAVPAVAEADNSGLLFYLSADKSLTADFAKGEAVPNFSANAAVVTNGRENGALKAGDNSVLSWKAPGNIYAKRGTVSFYWRARTALGRAPFVLFSAGYADHSSWDMAFLRIDYNGHGFDAFVTDNNLARTRVSFALSELPPPDAWSHIAFAWDENDGVRLYVDGKLVAEKKLKAVYDSGLDQFGMAYRAVSPHQVMSRYNFMRGSDYDEMRIYDHALDADQIAALAKGDVPAVAAQTGGDLRNADVLAEWRLRYGFNRPGDPPTELSSPVTTIRKVAFLEAKDVKEFMYKGIDGIAETTWPGVYNRSRLPGRSDYFPLPDWNVYVDGGKTYALSVADEPWNHVEIQGAAFGTLTYAKDDKTKEATIAERAKGQQRTYHQLSEERIGGILRFNNIEQETPIQEVSAYNIVPGKIPTGSVTQTYAIRANAAADSPDLDELNAFIKGRYTPDESAIVVALPDAAPSRPRPADAGRKLPLVHVLIPYEYGASPANLMLYRSWGYGWENMHDGLDGIAVTIPALKAKPDASGLIPINIQVKDPIWPERNMFDVTVAVKPGEQRTVWLDLRDRILPNKSLYLTFASASPDFDAAALDGTKIELKFKDRQAALKEHIEDRFMQVKDNWGFLVEEHTASKREALYQRVVADMTDLLRVDPDNKLAREYWTDITYGSQGKLAFVQPVPPKGVPLWAFRQIESLKGVRRFVNWWIDNRQADYGDFGGGLSDDTDLVEQWPGLYLLGVDRDKVKTSLKRVVDAVYRNGMMTNGLSTLMLDELHAYEDGVNSNCEAMYLDYGNPKVVERLMETVNAYNRIISVNPAGHMHFNTNWYSGTDSYREGPWEWGKYYSYVIMHPGILVGYYNGDPTAKKFIVGLADGILAHGKKQADGSWWFPDEINWRTDATRGTMPTGTSPIQTLWTAYRWTGDKKYLTPILANIERSGTGYETSVGGARVALDKVNLKGAVNLNENLMDVLNRHDSWGEEAVKRASKPSADKFERYLAWQKTGDKKYLEDLFGEELRAQGTTMYTQTEGHWWTDRVEVDNAYLQRTRMGGVGLVRNNAYPGATVSWSFADPEGALKVGILMPEAMPDHFKVIAYNISKQPVQATMTGWNVNAGEWEVRSGIAAAVDKLPDNAKAKTIAFEKTASTDVVFAPGKTTVYEFTLKTPTDAPEARADLGIGPEDVKIGQGEITVTVHSLGAKDAAGGTLELADAKGKAAVTAKVPALPAPRDLKPVTATVKLAVPAGFALKGAEVRVTLDGAKELTRMNNMVKIGLP